MTNEPMIADDELVELLKNALNTLPESTEVTSPPASVIQGAKLIHEWRTMDAELAELTFDSTASPELAGVRSTSSLRELTFVSGERTIEIEVEPGVRTVTISGNVIPPSTGKMQLMIGGELFEDNLDANGSFSIEGVTQGTVLAFVETSAGKIRLGSFEV